MDLRTSKANVVRVALTILVGTAVAGCGISPVDILLAQLFTPAEPFRIIHGDETDDPCLFGLANDPETIPNFDELRLTFIVNASQSQVACGAQSVGAFEAGYCMESGYLVLSSGAGFGTTRFFFDPNTRELVGITSQSDGIDLTCEGRTNYLNQIDCEFNDIVVTENLCPFIPVL